MTKSINFLLLLMTIKMMANVSLPYIFSDYMVLQRNAKIPIWGFAAPKEKIRIEFKSQIKTTVADEKGNWRIFFDEEKEGGPYELKIKANNELILKNILIGDVWLCSGQSNMEWTLAMSEGYQEEQNQKIFPEIRHIKIQHQINTLPQSNIAQTNWQVANPKTVGNFSAVAYFFAKKMYQERQVPIGIINSSWGGTVIEAWISNSAFEHSEYYKEMIAAMPKVDIKTLEQQNIVSKTAFVEKLIKTKISDFNKHQFIHNIDDTAFVSELYVPKTWEDQGFTGLDGVVWLRKTIDLSDDDLRSDAIIYLGKIDDEDRSYYNGVEIGGKKQWDEERIYTIPRNLLKKGKNIIAVRVKDNGGAGGFWSTADEVKLATSARTIPLAGNWKFAVEKIDTRINQNEFPSLIYNAMIHPIEDYKISGILWYQGESNESRAYEYRQAFPLLINSWREKFGQDIPFYFVQLATYETPGNSNVGCAWAELREAQTTALQLKNTGMVVTTDIGNPKDIHPRNKKAVGERLANLELKNGKVSPILESYKIEGNKITISFTPIKALKVKNNEIIKGFEIAGSDRVFYPAIAEVIDRRIVVYNDEVRNPVAVRFGWKGDNSDLNLFTEDDLPVSPFRTDDFETVTKNHAFQLELK